MAARERQAPSRALLIGLLVASAGASGCLGATNGDEPVATNEVVIPGPWVFEPAAIQVANGTEITWTNNGGQSHTVTFEALGIDEVIEPGGTVRLTLPAPGNHTYVCRFHPPDMAGTVQVLPETVREDAAGDGTSTTDAQAHRDLPDASD